MKIQAIAEVDSDRKEAQMNDSIVKLGPPSTTIEGDWGKPLEVKAFDFAELTEFLADPISYGDFDWSDPIALDEFETTRPFKGRYVAPLSF